MNNLQNNVVTLAGEIVSGAVFSHETYGEKFYEITLAVKRLSGMDDYLPVSVSEHLLSAAVKVGNKIGEARN